MTVSNPRCGPGGALGLARGVVHLAHLVHVDEGVEGAQVDAGEGAADGEPLALEPRGGGGHRHHRTVDGGRVEIRDPRQGHGVGADGWHDRSLGIEVSFPTARILACATFLGCEAPALRSNLPCQQRSLFGAYLCEPYVGRVDQAMIGA